MAAARIGRVRLKSGGTEVRVLRNPLPNDGENWRGKVVQHARKVGEYDEPGSVLVGFCVIGLFSDGAASVGLRWDKKRSPIPTALMPQYIAEVIRRDLITAPEAEEQACHVVNRSNGWED
jgi:hypothetical protein